MDAIAIGDRPGARSRTDADWKAIEREYRAGQLSVREIGRLHAVSHTAISKRARKEGWTQNLVARVRDEVATRLVSTEVASQAVYEAASRVISLVRQHREDIGFARQLVASLVAELQDASDQIDEIETAIEAETDSNSRRMMHRAVSLPARATVLTTLSVAMKNLIGLERQAFNLDTETPPTKTHFTFLPGEYEAIAKQVDEEV